MLLSRLSVALCWWRGAAGAVWLKMWWAQQDEAAHDKMRAVVTSGQLEFVNGGWSMQDETTPIYSDGTHKNDSARTPTASSQVARAQLRRRNDVVTHIGTPTNEPAVS